MPQPTQAQSFSYDELAGSIEQLQKLYNVQADRPAGGIKGLIGKLVRPFVHPVVADQNVVNAHVLHGLQELEKLAVSYEVLAKRGVQLDATVHKELAKPLEAVLQNNHDLLAQNARLEAELAALRQEVKALKAGVAGGAGDGAE